MKGCIIEEIELDVDVEVFLVDIHHVFQIMNIIKLNKFPYLHN